VSGDEQEPPLTWQEANAIILALMRIEAKLEEIRQLFDEDEDGEEPES
jgi:hypothetical protein